MSTNTGELLRDGLISEKEKAFYDGWEAGFRAGQDAQISELRNPSPEDAEVWACPVCGGMVDRHMMGVKPHVD